MAALFHSVIAFLAAISIISLTSFPLISSTTDTKGSNVLDFIHRDSPLSPLHNPLETNFDRLRNAFHRSQLQRKQFKHVSVSMEAMQSGIIPGDGEYYMRISVGSPPVQVLAIADTGSDLTWFQCQPCQECYKQDGPIYDSRKSSTYHDVPCGTESCNSLGLCTSLFRPCLNGTCQYSCWYGDGSFSKGKLATEKITLIGSSPNGTTSSTALPRDIVFGCGTNNDGTYDAIGSGIVGLGGGDLSLVSQLGNETGRQFSYCLVPTSEESKNITSKIKIGRDSVVSGQGAVSTPFVLKNPYTCYYLTLEAISVVKKRLANNNTWDGSIQEGNIVIDSGTTVTYLESNLFDEVQGAVVEAVHAERVSDPKGNFDICFRVKNDSELPVITAHFTGADVELNPLNAFVTLEDGLRCLTMGPTDDGAIFGNTAQMNYEVGYDLDKRVVSFRAADCAKLF